MEADMILVTGATGNTGGATLRALVDQGAEVRALVHDPDKLKAPAGVDVVVADFHDTASLDAALAGADHAYLVGPSVQDQVELETAFVRAAQRAGLAHLVRLSINGADRPDGGTVRFIASHMAMEQIVRESGIPWTFVRANGFMQNHLGQAQVIAAQGAFYSALSTDTRVSYLDARDIGEVAAKVLTEPGHQGRAYELTGPEALNDDDLAARLSEALGRSIAHVQVPWETLRESLIGNGYPEWNVDGFQELGDSYETGVSTAVSPDIERLLGRPPRSFAEFVADHRAAFGG
jgi:uncharacterized protein YbjT (DUF2867 family)